MQRQEIEELVSDCILRHRESYDDIKQKWVDLVERYENKLRENSISAKTDSKVSLGSAYALVENFIARLLNRQPKYKYLGRESDDVKGADIYQEFSEYQFDEAECETELEEVARWGAVCGLAGWKMGWKEETTVTMKDGIEVMGVKMTNPVVIGLASKIGKGKKVKVEEKNTVSNYTFKAIKPFDLIWNTESVGMRDIRILGHREMRYIKELKQQGYEVDQLEQSIRSNQNYWEKQLQDNNGQSESQIMDMQRVEVAEMYVKYIDGDVWKNSMMTMAGLESGVPVSIQFNERPFDKPFIPMGIFRPVNRLGKFYGYGMIEPVEGILDAEEDSFNIALTALWTDVARPMEYNPQNILDVDSFEYGARKLVPVRQLGASVSVMPTPTPNIAGTNILLQYLQKAKQNDTGITDFQTGADQIGGQKTLGEIKIKTAESNARIQKIIRNFETQVLEPMGRYALYLNQQFLSGHKEIMYRIIGRKGSMMEKSIKFNDIDAIKDISIISGSTALIEQTAELQKWMAVLNAIYMEEKSVNPTPINKEPIWERIFADGLLQPDVETYLPNAQELEAENVGNKMTQLEDATQESDNPAIARVLPTDDHQVHLKIHQAVANSGFKSDHSPLSPEEKVMLTDHINAHTQAVGGQVPAFSQSISNAVGQHIQNQVPQPMANQPMK